MTALGWAAGLLVLCGVLTTWIEPSTGGLIHAGAFTLLGLSAFYALLRRIDVAVCWMVLLPLACAAWGVFQESRHWTVSSFDTWNSVTAWLARAAIFAAAYAGFQDDRQRRRLKIFAVRFGGLFSLLVMLQWYTAAGTIFWMIATPYNSEVAGTFVNRDEYAALIELLLPIALAASIREKRPDMIAVMCAGLMFASVVASGSRAGTIIVCLEAFVFVTAASFGRLANRRAAGIIATSLVLCTLLGGWSYVLKRFSDSPDLFAYRREMWTSTLNMIRSQPIHGFGLGTWPTVYPAFAVFDPPGVFMNHAHNDWAEWTAEGGLPFLAMLLIFACAAVPRTRKDLWALGIPALFAHAAVDFPLQKPALALALFFFAGVYARSKRNHFNSIAAKLPEIPQSRSPLQV